MHRYAKYKSSWLLALIPAIIIAAMLPKPVGRFSLTVEEPGIKGHWTYYEDLNSDGESELLMAVNDTPLSAIGVMTNEGKWYDQWNVRDSLVNGISKLFFGDYDRDGKKEIYVFTIKRDSLFLSINEFFDSKGLIIEREFITKIGLVHGKMQHTTLDSLGFYDQDGDGKDEFYFGVQSGFGLWPRLLYIFNSGTRKLNSSPYTSINLIRPQMQDVDDDGKPEIFGQSNASGNHHFPTPYSDYSAWLMVYNDQLQFKFKPVEFPGFANSVWVKTFTKEEKTFFLVNLTTGGTMADSLNMIPQLMVYTANGSKIKSKPVSEFGNRQNVFTQVLKTETRENILVLSDKLHIVNSDLEIEESITLPFEGETTIEKVDIDQTGDDELILFAPGNRKLFFYNSKIEPLGELNLKNNSSNVFHWSHHRSLNGPTKLFIQSDSDGYFIQVKENPYHSLQNLRYPAVYIALVFFIMFVQKITVAQVEKREQQKRRIQDLKLRSIKGQLDPHFTFNVLNAIGSMLQLEDRNVAYDYLSRFTRLLRQLIGDSDRIYRSLEEELEFVTAYLQLEKIRFEEKFKYIIHIDDAVSKKEMVPIMCIQVFAENALRHGIMPMESGGLIKIVIRKDNECLLITIYDNGVGRKRAVHDNNGTGRGLKMTEEFYDILNQSGNRKITFSISDAEPNGTIVDLRVSV